MRSYGRGAYERTICRAAEVQTRCISFGINTLLKMWKLHNLIEAVFGLQIIKSTGEITFVGMANSARHRRSSCLSEALEQHCAYRSFETELLLASWKVAG